jgi:hypothetical protein
MTTTCIVHGAVDPCQGYATTNGYPWRLECDPDIWHCPKCGALLEENEYTV